MDELEDHYYYPLTAADADAYNNPHPFGDVVANDFPSAQNDLQHAVRCMVFGQSTAAAFHVMRAVEVGLKAFAKRVSIEYQSSWEGYCGKIQKALEKPYPQKTRAERQFAPRLREILGDLVAIKIAWRNPTMHVERRYSQNEAFHVLTLSQTLMERLAECGIKERKVRSLPVEDQGQLQITDQAA
jgi:hypothetical protein